MRSSGMERVWFVGRDDAALWQAIAGPGSSCCNVSGGEGDD